jgi:hypothetical protein
MTYNEYLFSQLLAIYDEDFKVMPYDEQWELVPQMYLDFINSNFNNESKGEYDCIVNYLNADKHKVSAVANEIVEAIFDMNAFDNINADVWALISKRVGFPVQNKSDYADETKYIKELEHRLNMIDDDAAKLRTFIIEKELGDYFLDSDFVYLSNIDIACDLNDDECLSWKRYKITQ